MLPEVAELALLLAHNEERILGANLLEAFGPHLAKLAQGDLQTLVNDLAVDVGDFRHAVRLAYVAVVAHVVHDEDPDIGQRHEHFARPLLRKMRRAHRDRGEPLAGRMHEARSNRHQGLSAPAFSNHLGGASALFPELDGSHDGECLSWERLATKF